VKSDSNKTMVRDVMDDVDDVDEDETFNISGGFGDFGDSNSGRLTRSVSVRSFTSREKAQADNMRLKGPKAKTNEEADYAAGDWDRLVQHGFSLERFRVIRMQSRDTVMSLSSCDDLEESTHDNIHRFGENVFVEHESDFPFARPPEATAKSERRRSMPATSRELAREQEFLQGKHQLVGGVPPRSRSVHNPSHQGPESQPRRWGWFRSVMRRVRFSKGRAGFQPLEDEEDFKD